VNRACRLATFLQRLGGLEKDAGGGIPDYLSRVPKRVIEPRAGGNGQPDTAQGRNSLCVAAATRRMTGFNQRNGADPTISMGRQFRLIGVV
jgi:hypothetical protein